MCLKDFSLRAASAMAARHWNTAWTERAAGLLRERPFANSGRA